MSVTRIVCPHCSHHLKTGKALHAGQHAHCPACGQSFVVQGASPHIEPAPNAIAPPQLLPDALQPVAGVSRARLWAGIIVGGVLLLIPISIGLMYFLAEDAPSSGTKKQAALSSLDDPTTTTEDRTAKPDTPPEPPWLPEIKQVQTNKAIDRGVSWLLKQQSKGGSWVGRRDPLRTHPVGMAALPAVTLLECGVSKNAPQIRKAAELVRKAVPRLDLTYDLSLAILFLDHLQEAEDRPRIRSMALRLVAGQQKNGGWTYHCPVLNEKEEPALLTALEKTRPNSLLDLFQHEGHKMELGLFIQAPKSGGVSKNGGGRLEPILLQSGNGLGDSTRKRPNKLSQAEHRKVLDKLPARLRSIPSLQSPPAFNARAGNADNSNTQFAILALLAAQRYQMALERPLAMVVRRFHATQRSDGFWTYRPTIAGPPRPSMTGTGLLGLAVKYGLVLNSSRHKGQPITIQDAAIDKALKALSEYIGHRILWGRKDARSSEDRLTLYAMWSIERVGALYHLRRINGKEWYLWGVGELLKRQNGDGAWHVGDYAGATVITDTCFALLFLRRADFAPELSKKFEFFREGENLLGR